MTPIQVSANTRAGPWATASQRDCRSCSKCSIRRILARVRCTLFNKWAPRPCRICSSVFKTRMWDAGVLLLACSFRLGTTRKKLPLRCGWQPADGGSRLETQGEWGFQVYHCITPETATSSHQFWALAHEQSAVAPAGREEFYRQCHQVVLEDLAVYEAQQRSLDTEPAGASAEDVRARVVIEADRGLLMARAILRDMLAQKAAA